MVLITAQCANNPAHHRLQVWLLQQPGTNVPLCRDLLMVVTPVSQPYTLRLSTTGVVTGGGNFQCSRSILLQVGLRVLGAEPGRAGLR